MAKCTCKGFSQTRPPHLPNFKMDELIKFTLAGDVLHQMQSSHLPILAVAVFDWLFNLVGDSFQNVLHFFVFVFMVVIKTAFFQR